MLGDAPVDAVRASDGGRVCVIDAADDDDIDAVAAAAALTEAGAAPVEAEAASDGDALVDTDGVRGVDADRVIGDVDAVASRLQYSAMRAK